MAVESAEGRRVETADWLVLCNGLFSRPHVPSWPGREEFEQAGGRVVSPADLGDGEASRGKKLVVLGWGKSATDIATGSLDAAASVDVVARNIGWSCRAGLAGSPGSGWSSVVPASSCSSESGGQTLSSACAFVCSTPFGPARSGTCGAPSREIWSCIGAT